MCEARLEPVADLVSFAMLQQSVVLSPSSKALFTSETLEPTMFRCSYCFPSRLRLDCVSNFSLSVREIWVPLARIPVDCGSVGPHGILRRLSRWSG